MFNIDDVKKIAINAAEEEKMRRSSELNETISNISNCYSFPKVIEEFVEIYGNNKTQREKMIAAFRTLPGDLFQNGSIVEQMNYVGFYFNRINFLVPTSRLKALEITINKINKPSVPKKKILETFSPYEEDFLLYWENLKEISEANDKGVVDEYFKLRFGRKTPFFKLKEMRRDDYKDIKIYVEDIRKRVNLYLNEKSELKDLQEKYEDSLEKYNSKINDRNESLQTFFKQNNDLLNDFKQSGWRVNFTNLPEEFSKLGGI